MSSFPKCRALRAVANKVRKCSRRGKRELLPEVSAPLSQKIMPCVNIYSWFIYDAFTY